MRKKEIINIVYDEKCIKQELSFKVIYRKKSNFQEIIIGENECFGKTLLLDKEIQLSSYDEFVFHEMFAYSALSFFPNSKNFLILGGGDGFLSYYLLKHFKNKEIKIDVVEIDKEVPRITRKYFKKSKKAFEDKSKRVNLIIGDALKFNPSNKYDVVFVDLVDYTTNPKLYTKTAIKKFKSFGKAIVFHSDFEKTKNLIKKLKSLFTNIKAFSAYVPSFFSLWDFIICSDKKLDERKAKKAKVNGKYFDPKELWDSKYEVRISKESPYSIYKKR